jgi:hypothetical protein
VKWNSLSRTGILFLAGGMLGAGVAVALRCFEISGASDRGKLNDNPDKFYLWTNHTAIHHAFTYDPQAADVWAFESGGGNLTNRQQSVKVTNSVDSH